MELIGLKNWAKSWSTWVLGAVTVTPVLSSNAQWVADLVPEQYRSYAVTALGILGLIVRAIKQK